MKFSISILIKKPQADVFRYLTNPAKLPEWMQGLQNVHPIKGRRSQVGGQSKLQFKEGNTSFSINEEVLHYNRHDQFTVYLNHSEMTTVIDYILEKRNADTLLTATYEIKFKNIISRIFSVFFKTPMRNQQTNDFKKLKQCIEVVI
jgi:uncharacterized protein YndB with AHSA1/START domain